MSKIVYKMDQNGRACNLRNMSDNYVLKSDEEIIEGDVLPYINSLHSSEYLDALDAEKQKKDSYQLDMILMKEKYKGKKKTDLTDANVKEYMKLKMVIELGLE